MKPIIDLTYNSTFDEMVEILLSGDKLEDWIISLIRAKVELEASSYSSLEKEKLFNICDSYQSCYVDSTIL